MSRLLKIYEVDIRPLVLSKYEGYLERFPSLLIEEFTFSSIQGPALTQSSQQPE
jgi:hypothetical protein